MKNPGEKSQTCILAYLNCNTLLLQTLHLLHAIYILSQLLSYYFLLLLPFLSCPGVVVTELSRFLPEDLIASPLSRVKRG